MRLMLRAKLHTTSILHPRSELLVGNKFRRCGSEMNFGVYWHKH